MALIGPLPSGAAHAVTSSLSATPLTIEPGASARLDWTATDVSGCTALGGWSGSRAASGQEEVAPTSTTTYTLRCEGPAGTTVRSVTVGVKGDDCEASDVCTLDSPTRTCLFRVAVADGEIVRISVHERDTTLAARWRLLTAAATPAASCGSLRSGESDCGPLAAGEYTIQVSAASGTGTASVHRQHLTGCASTRLDCDQEVHDEIIPVGDVDLFRFSATAGERLRLTVRELTGSAEAEWRLLTAAGARPGVCDTFRRSLAEDCGPLPAGDYQIQVRDEQGLRTGTYAIHLQRLTASAACDVTALVCDQTLRGDVDHVTDSDLFRFSVGANEVIRLVVDERGGALVAEWRLLAESGAPAPACATFTTARAADCGPLPAGAYLIEVKDDVARHTGSYELSLFNLVNLCENCGNGVLTPGEQCDPPGPCCTSRCRFVLPSAICRARTGPCDVPELCSGTSGICPDDRFEEVGTPCRPAVDVCDAPEVCSGLGPACPADALAPAGTECRPAAGDCDVRETCSGNGTSCGPDLKRTGACRPAAGGCDVAERCDGISDDCPVDRLAPAGTICRAAVDHCDVAERCTGDGSACPANGGTALACADGCVDAREQCGEPGLPDCAAGTVCTGCVCLPCASVTAACEIGSVRDGAIRVQLVADTAVARWTGTLGWDPSRLRLDRMDPASGGVAPACTVDDEAGTATCEGTGAPQAESPTGAALARASFTPVGEWPSAAGVTFSPASLASATGDPALLCALPASCAVPACGGAADCDDDDACTSDVCTDGRCVHTRASGFGGADCEIAQILRGLACGEQPADRKLVRMLYRRIGKARLLLARAALRPGATRRVRLVRRADRVLAATQREVAHGRLARPCATSLAAAIEERRGLLAVLAADTASRLR